MDRFVTYRDTMHCIVLGESNVNRPGYTVSSIYQTGDVRSMADYPLFQRTMRAAAQGRSAEANELLDQIPKADVGMYNMYILAMFTVCVDVRFEQDASPEAIRAFGDEMRYDYRNAEPPVQQHVVEGTVRSVLGEEELFDELPPLEQHRTRIMAIRKIVGESPKMQENLGKYLDEAEAVARELEDV